LVSPVQLGWLPCLRGTYDTRGRARIVPAGWARHKLTGATCAA
jgi:hypothetical protein